MRKEKNRAPGVSVREPYMRTIYASSFGMAMQAVVNNFAPLLFLTFTSEFSLSLPSITLITTINFAVQLLMDLLSVTFVDRIGYRASITAAHGLISAGLTGLAVLPGLLRSPLAGILLSVVLYAAGGGLIEVLTPAIADSCPTPHKASAMSFMHSFYSWGQVLAVLLSTVFFSVFGIAHWRAAALLWAVLPLLNGVFFLTVPLYPVVPEGTEKVPFRILAGKKIFWLIILIMICSGASELAMSQWASYFAEAGLHVSKTAGDLLGPCMFAVFMGIARMIYGKWGDRIPIRKVIPVSAAFCVLCYALAVIPGHPLLSLAGCALCGATTALFWPGTLSLVSEAIPGGGTLLFALCALAGDVGCSGGPTLVGLVSAASGGQIKSGLTAAAVFPVLILISYLILRPGKDTGKTVL